MQSKETTVALYLKSLAPEQAATLKKVRAFVKKHLPKGYQETMQYGMITYVVPLKMYPAGYLGKKDVALPYVSIAAQKNYNAIYLSNMYSDSSLKKRFDAAYKASGKKLNMGKSCLRFQTIEDIALEAVAIAVATSTPQAIIQMYEKSRSR
ncbi:DUF1801 domain-containing protein [Patescibacteria group bacterium]|nr:DUF1801 domain-containing protein [Patescibacteria group bacterium]